MKLPSPSINLIGYSILLFHFTLLFYFFDNVSLNLLVVLIVWFVLQLGIHGGYHRYVSHQSFQAHPWFEFTLCLAGALAFQKGPIWWASKHRQHHQHADTNKDSHSPTRGLFHAHMGWLFQDGMQQIEQRYVTDLLRRPTLLWLESFQNLILTFYALGIFFGGGIEGILNWWVLPVVICWHTTFLTNSACHVIGTHPEKCHPKDYCNAKNNIVVAFLNLGEGWHNNHHANPSLCHHGFHRWYQIDIVYLIIRIFQFMGVTSNLKKLSNNTKAK